MNLYKYLVYEYEQLIDFSKFKVKECTKCQTDGTQQLAIENYDHELGTQQRHDYLFKLKIECPFYHSKLDQRRTVISDSYDQLFYIDELSNPRLKQDHRQIEKHYECQNLVEYYYHPLVYKTIKCQQYENCRYRDNCPFFHFNENSNQSKVNQLKQLITFYNDTNVRKVDSHRNNSQKKINSYSNDEFKNIQSSIEQSVGDQQNYGLIKNTQKHNYGSVGNGQNASVESQYQYDNQNMDCKIVRQNVDARMVQSVPMQLNNRKINNDMDQIKDNLDLFNQDQMNDSLVLNYFSNYHIRNINYEQSSNYNQMNDYPNLYNCNFQNNDNQSQQYSEQPEDQNQNKHQPYLINQNFIYETFQPIGSKDGNQLDQQIQNKSSQNGNYFLNHRKSNTELNIYKDKPKNKETNKDRCKQKHKDKQKQKQKQNSWVPPTQESNNNTNMENFKVIKCQKEKSNHNVKKCFYYHSNKIDHRRCLKQYKYSSELCRFRENNCKHGKQCQYAHNKIEQLYHPDRYKMKFCIHMSTNLNKCEYGEYCSFAHDEQSIRIPLLHKMVHDYNFITREFKTIWCPFSTNHDRITCVYAHNPQDLRRNITLHQYSHEECPYWKNNVNVMSYEEGGCPDMMQCKFAHGWKEKEYHPHEYKSKICPNYLDCNKKFCQFLHHDEQNNQELLAIKQLYIHLHPQNNLHYNPNSQQFGHNIQNFSQNHQKNSAPYKNESIQKQIKLSKETNYQLKDSNQQWFDMLNQDISNIFSTEFIRKMQHHNLQYLILKLYQNKISIQQLQLFSQEKPPFKSLKILSTQEKSKLQSILSENKQPKSK